MSIQDTEMDERTGHAMAWRDLSVEDAIAGIGLVVIVLAVGWGVVTRYLLATPASWTSEAAAIAFAWTVFVGAAAAFRRQAHIVIDIFVELLPASLRRPVQWVSDAIVLATLAVMSVLAIRFCVATHGVPMTILRVPQSTIYAGAAVGFLLMTWRYAAIVRCRFRGAST